MQPRLGGRWRHLEASGGKILGIQRRRARRRAFIGGSTPGSSWAATKAPCSASGR